jgi:antitoxin ParD1/3/4/toxin ParE1/3/4
VKPYLLTTEAEQDVEAIKIYLVAKGGKPLALHVFARLRSSMRFLGKRPASGHARPDLTAEPVKFWQVFSYLVIYDPVPQPIHIIRVMHASRDLKSLLSDHPPQG